MLRWSEFESYKWSARAIDRTTPMLLGLFSVVTLIAHQLHAHQALHTRQAAWYKKEAPTFSDALASVRRQIWRSQGFVLSQVEDDRTKSWTLHKPISFRHPRTPCKGPKSR